MATEVATLLFEADTRPLKAANDELAKTERTAVKAQDSARKWGTSLKNAANDSVGPIQKVSSGLTAVQSALLAIAGSLAVRELVSLTDQWTDLNSRLRNATGSVEAADEALQAISQTARTTYSSLQQPRICPPPSGMLWCSSATSCLRPLEDWIKQRGFRRQ